MIDPFIQPKYVSAADAIREIGDELSIFDDWPDGYYDFIMDVGKKLPRYPDAWKTAAHKVEGCLAQVWLASEQKDDKLYFAGASDSLIVAGLVALILEIFSGRTKVEILGVPKDTLKNLGLIKSLTANRGNGVAAMAERIQAIARA